MFVSSFGKLESVCVYVCVCVCLSRDNRIVPQHTCYNRKSTGVTDNINNGSILFSVTESQYEQ